MRKILKINEGWQFVKDCQDPSVTEGAVPVTLPHTWNNEDGYDGGTYFRGSCVYSKSINKDELGEGLHYLEIRGANSSAEARFLPCHRGCKQSSDPLQDSLHKPQPQPWHPCR